METTATTEITFEDFLKVDIRTGTILTAERVPKSKKLIKLQVNFGELGDRQIVAGIGETFEDHELPNAKVLAVVNLAPRKLMGLESHGMILATADKNGRLYLTKCSDVPNGTRVG